MICPQCSNSMIKTKATDNGPEYDYCRTCKKELLEMIPLDPNFIGADYGDCDTTVVITGDVVNRSSNRKLARTIIHPSFAIFGTGNCYFNGIALTHIFQKDICNCGNAELSGNV